MARIRLYNTSSALELDYARNIRHAKSVRIYSMTSPALNPILCWVSYSLVNVIRDFYYTHNLYLALTPPSSPDGVGRA